MPEKTKECLFHHDRKVIQLAVNDACTRALCNDGTMWMFVDGAWVQMPAIPQGK